MPIISFTTKATQSEEQCKAEAKNDNGKWEQRTCEAKYDDWQQRDSSQEMKVHERKKMVWILL